MCRVQDLQPHRRRNEAITCPIWPDELTSFPPCNKPQHCLPLHCTNKLNKHPLDKTFWTCSHSPFQHKTLLIHSNLRLWWPKIFTPSTHGAEKGKYKKDGKNCGKVIFFQYAVVHQAQVWHTSLNRQRSNNPMEKLRRWSRAVWQNKCNFWNLLLLEAKKEMMKRTTKETFLQLTQCLVSWAWLEGCWDLH